MQQRRHWHKNVEPSQQACVIVLSLRVAIKKLYIYKHTYRYGYRYYIYTTYPHVPLAAASYRRCKAAGTRQYIYNIIIIIIIYIYLYKFIHLFIYIETLRESLRASG